MDRGAGIRASGVEQGAGTSAAGSDAVFHSICEAVPDIVFRSAGDGKWEHVNGRFYDVTGAAPGSALGDGWARALHPEDEVAARQRWLRAAATGGDLQIECRLRTPAGSYRWHMLRSRAVRGADGSITHRVGAMTDIHDLRTTIAELEAFGHAVSHDLREPLRSIKLITQFLMEDSPGMDETAAGRLVRLGDLAMRADRMVSALREHARLGGSEVRRTSNDLAEIVAQTVETLRAGLADSGGAVEVVTPLPVVSCDRALMQRVLGTLIENGLKFNRSERKRIQIGAEEPESPTPTIFVRDNGIGIDPGKSDAIFGMFTRLHAAGEFGGGIGAGLAIARRILERHGGRIWVEPEPGGGSTFRFTVPR